LLLVLTACSSPAQPLATSSVTPLPSTGTLLPSPTTTVTLIPVHNEPKTIVKPAITPSPEPPPETAPPVVGVCSPLADHSLDELPAIVSDPYHPPPMGKDDRHQGVDFSYYRQEGRATIAGEGVQSVLEGRVAAAVYDSFPFGNLVIVETVKEDLPNDLLQKLKLGVGQSLYVLYAHLEAPPLVQTGDAVQACQALGAVGKSGNAGVAHLHLETRIGPAGTLFSGMAYYTPQASQQERENYVLWRKSGVFQHFDPMTLLGN
jgi:murein DD-endopeptidase MepM/ murein hydrolase activator NlpD